MTESLEVMDCFGESYEYPDLRHEPGIFYSNGGRHEVVIVRRDPSLIKGIFLAIIGCKIAVVSISFAAVAIVSAPMLLTQKFFYPLGWFGMALLVMSIASDCLKAARFHLL